MLGITDVENTFSIAHAEFPTGPGLQLDYKFNSQPVF
jgi:hypothetical protein